MSVGTKTFRQSTKYLKRFNAFGDQLRAHLESKEAGKPYDELEQLMLEAYRFMKFIRKEGGILTTESPKPRPIDTAILEAMSILDEPLEYCVPLHYEADALECLSYSAWKTLKDKNLMQHCKHCQAWKFGGCKTHKKAATIIGMVYCAGCHGYIHNLCPVHGPDMCRDVL